MTRVEALEIIKLLSALEALCKMIPCDDVCNCTGRQAITAIKEALAQPEQEPCGGCGGSGWVPRDPDIGTDQECFVCNGSGTQPNEPEQEESLELFEYWNAVEGWVKIEEVRKHFGSVGCGTIYKTAGEDRVPVYTTPPKRPWVGLTDEKIAEVAERMEASDPTDSFWREFARAIEAKLKEKNP